MRQAAIKVIRKNKIWPLAVLRSKNDDTSGSVGIVSVSSDLIFGFGVDFSGC